ncbi:transcriptional regulator FeaR [Marinobacter sp. 1_MG-2023]|uniref:transcriptional regulator FeaR n=1 Tax=Marinobacter sp. 1_MG-2023 TaxID=3062627 RepID=UPI0026E3AAAA|nr:transcriptional regulator FeaR [Marinobacter sp. 1_MG-2023]MDO6823052.1 transcriptional regulator FeaR [Marinobacter sp. 1_MG-2023]
MSLRTGGTDDFDRWISNINDICGPFLANPVGDEFSGSVEKVGGSLDMSRVSIRGADLYRTPKEIQKSGVPDFFCVFQIQGCSLVEQVGNRSSLTPGDIVLVDSALPFRFSYQKLAQQISLILPRQIIERILNLSKVELGVKIPADSHIARFATKLVLEASRHENLDIEEGAAILDSLATLIKPSVLKSVHSTEPYDKIFRAASEFVKNNIGEPGLNASMVANSVGTSVRSLHRAFAGNSITLSEYVKAQRLEMCADYIRANSGRLSLTEVVYRFGFGSSSYFSTAFKGRFGMTPSDFRKRCSPS